MSDSHNDTLVDPFTHTNPTRTGSPRPTLTILKGTDVGRVFLLEEGSCVVGRSPEVAIHIPHESISRQHCEVIIPPSGHTLIRDLGSTNGTRVNDVEVSSNHTVLVGGERVQLSKRVVLKFAYQDVLERSAQEDLYCNAVRDPLTGAYNKRFFMERAEHEIAYAGRHGSPLTLLIFDLDHFKQINDSYGHPAGDAVLTELAGRVDNTLRSEDVLARYGGEEFVVLMRNTPMPEAIGIAQRLRRAISDKPVAHDGQQIQVTVSIGVSDYDTSLSSTVDALIARADTNLYKAKTLGRDRVVSD